MTDAVDLTSPRLARMLRSSRRGEQAALSYVASGPGGGPRPDGGRRTRGGRLADGFAWALAAWAEILDRAPQFTVARRAGGRERVDVVPWRDGKASAWAYLWAMGDDRLRGGPARQMLLDLTQRGVTQ